MRTVAVAVLCAALCASVFGSEQVPRLKTTRQTLGFANISITLTDEYALFAPPNTIDAELAKAVFTVYTQGEIDSQRAADQKRIADLEAKLAVLEQNVRRLSEINDTLTKQLEDLQKQQAKTQK
jgi:hypothetical protein